MHFDSRYRLRLAAGSLLSSLLWLAVAGVVSPVRAEDWYVDSWLRLGAGNETELLETPDMYRQTVPRGGFVDVAPGCVFYRRTASGALLSFMGNAYYEYFDASSRSLFSSSLWTEIRQPLSGPWRLRTGAGGSFFNDSTLLSNRRFDGHGIVAVGPVGCHWSLEAEVAGRGRRYPELFVWIDTGDTSVYMETGWSTGLRLGWSPTPAFWLVVRGARAETDSRDFYYDVHTLRGEALAGWRPWPGTTVLANLLGEERDYFRRDPAGNSEYYLLAGGGIDQELSASLSLSLRFTFSVYDGDDDRVDMHRLAAGLTWRFGRAAARPARRFDPPAGKKEHLAGESLVFEVSAPGATSVSLVGDFNGWNPSAHAMIRGTGGHWSVTLFLPEGAYQYAYLVDGELVTPPDAEETMDDGFGGRNGLLKIFAEASNPTPAVASQ